MKHNFIRNSVIVLLIGLGALTSGQAYAQEQNNPIQIQSLSWGLSQGQTARISVANFILADGSVRSVTVRIQLLDLEGEVLTQSDNIRVAPGQTRFWDVPRESLPGGEPTGRLQVRARIFVTTQTILRQSPLAPSVELHDSGTGRTMAIFDAFLKIEGVPGESKD
jgi:hypothetical protein